MPARTITVLLTVLAATALLSSCSLLNPGPPRDADGAITETTVASTRYLAVDDCFSFTSDPAEIELSPCGDPHTHVVIGQGTLTPADVDAAGGMQNAVSASCSEPFASFKDEVVGAGGTKPDQEFIVVKQEVDEQEVFAYSCVATDAAVTAAG